MAGLYGLPCVSMLAVNVGLSAILGCGGLHTTEGADGQSVGQAQAPTIALQRVELEDAAGDANPQYGSQPDLRRLILESDGKNLTLQLVFDRDLEPILRERTETIALGEVFFDKDDDPTTGVEDSNFGESAGFEYRSTIATGLRFADGTHLWGTASEKPAGRNVVEYYVGDTLLQFTAPHTGDEVREPPGGRGSFTGKTATLRYGYDSLDVRPGAVVRVKFYKLGTKNVFKAAYLPEVRIRLR